MASTLEEIAKLLPQEQTERFLTLVAQFKTVPDDDEYLQLMEAIGLMTLLWKEVPNEIKTILEGVKPTTETNHSFAMQMRDAVIEAIPSDKDLKQISKRLEGHELALKRTLSANIASTQRGSSFLELLIAFAVGVLVCFFGYEHFTSIFLR